MRRSAVAGTAVALALAGCATTVPGVATPAAQARPEALEPRVRALFDGMVAASQQGLQPLIEYLVEHNHPVLDYTVQECMAHARERGATDDDVLLSYDIDAGSLVEDPDFVIIGGRDDGAVPAGDVYAVRTSMAVVEGGETSTSTSTDHVGVLHDEVYLFTNCGW